MPMSKDKALIAVTVPKEFKVQLEQMAKQEKRSLSNYISIVLEDHVKQKKTQNEFLQAENNENHN